MNFSPHTTQDIARMLAKIGVQTQEELFAVIPAEHRFPGLDLPQALSEMSAAVHMRQLSELNADLNHHSCFLGAGAYNHYVPSVVNAIISRGEFYTAYTPYQPEISQGTLQSIYEFQTLVCELTGLDVANASMYDGSTALAEAAIMSINATQRSHVLIAGTVHPEYRAVTRTYTNQRGDFHVDEVNARQGTRLTAEDLRTVISPDTACVIVQQPNFFGTIEDLAPLAAVAHEFGALFVVNYYPIALAMLKSPGEVGVDIAVADGQCLGNALSYGGPSVGLFACKQKFLRFMPGRIVGATKDTQGRRGYVLTLQTREQHIRREKATSNICTNQALNALCSTVYLELMGKQGLREVADLCYQKAHYAAKSIAELPGFTLANPTEPFFNEFVVRCPVAPEQVSRHLKEAKIIGGYALGEDYPDLSDCLLFAVTELNTREEIDKLVQTLHTVVAQGEAS